MFPSNLEIAPKKLELHGICQGFSANSFDLGVQRNKVKLNYLFMDCLATCTEVSILQFFLTLLGKTVGEMKGKEKRNLPSVIFLEGC